jgi:release factor glutamine methyltransferase
MPGRRDLQAPSQPRDWSIDAMRRSVAQAFRARGLCSPELDARLIVGHALGLDHTGLVAQSDRLLTAVEASLIMTLADRRLGREPVARIHGYKEFWGLRLELNADTLVPRPETETVVEAALAAVDRRFDRARPLRLADLGTGSGALLLALLAELPHAEGVGTDLNAAALACARRNAHALGFGARAGFIACDYGDALAGPFDLVVSNPPYIPHGTIASLAPEVRVFDPTRALDGGEDGLDGYRAIASDICRLLSPSGMLVVELGADQCGAAKVLFDAAGLVAIEARRDLAGIERALTGFRISERT